MNARFFTLIVALVCSSSVVTAQLRLQMVADDGFEYLSLHGPTGVGAATIDGRIIIPQKFGNVFYMTSPVGGWFLVKAQGSNIEGAYTKTGQCIIPLARGYNNVIVMDEGWISVRMNDMYGACDMSGREIVPPIYEALRYDEDKGFQSMDDYGDFNDIGVWIPKREPKSEGTVTTRNQNKNQNGTMPIFVESDNSSYNDSSSSSTTSNQKQRKTCTRCHGEKTVVYERSVSAGRGLDRMITTCTECGKSYDRTETVHRHETCTSCHGLGYY